MKNYDFKKAKSIIAEHSTDIESASLGMHEDWFWTAETIWEGGKFKRELPEDAESIFTQYAERRKSGMSLLDEESRQYDNILIAGIYCSYWATPTLQLTFKDGSDKMIPCFTGDSDGEQPAGLLGCMSARVQANIAPLSE